jgi:hypothetical protein
MPDDAMNDFRRLCGAGCATTAAAAIAPAVSGQPYAEALWAQCRDCVHGRADGFDVYPGAPRCRGFSALGLHGVDLLRAICPAGPVAGDAAVAAVVIEVRRLPASGIMPGCEEPAWAFRRRRKPEPCHPERSRRTCVSPHRRQIGCPILAKRGWDQHDAHRRSIHPDVTFPAERASQCA